jgi:hypothetical protein
MHLIVLKFFYLGLINMAASSAYRELL